MKVVFDTKPLAPAKRRQAWRDAICEIYLQVDCVAEQDNEYAGFVREARFGAVTLTDTLLSPQSIRRQNRHIAHFDKDCYYAGIEQIGRLNICQADSSFLLRPGIGSVYYANEPYELQCDLRSRQFWIELPRQAFDSRFEFWAAASSRAFRSQPRPGPHRRRILRRPCGGGRRARSSIQSEARRAVYGHPRPGFEWRTWPPAGRREKRARDAAPVGEGLHRRASERPRPVVDRDSEE